ncbi:LOW QUALITY PROTEIN: hypothetical protein QYF61_017255 [Mycteria americana]|uniref:Uncharacterized protein n=1 Tax=Mycteria americana TaxID=33587 RepID=A0AAN7S1B2_MYCAM|nr:LOW QUALITY PROTEIN: hypothetical protein QYF61_017255 [Mycteria americana]
MAFREQESQSKADLQNSNCEAKSYLKGTLQLIISSHKMVLASAMPYGQTWPHSHLGKPQGSKPWCQHQGSQQDRTRVPESPPTNCEGQAAHLCHFEEDRDPGLDAGEEAAMSDSCSQFPCCRQKSLRILNNRHVHTQSKDSNCNEEKPHKGPGPLRYVLQDPRRKTHGKGNSSGVPGQKITARMPLSTHRPVGNMEELIVNYLLAGDFIYDKQKEGEQAEQPQLSQPVLIGEVLQPSDHSLGPPLDPLQQVHVLLVLRAPELDAVLQVGSHQSRAEGQNHLPRPAGHASFDAAQDMVGLLGCERTLLAHDQLFVHQYPRVLFHRAALDHIIPQPVLKPRIAPTQDPALGLVEPHKVHTDPLLQLVQVPLDDIPSFWCVSCPTQLGVTCKIPEGALDLAVNVIDENIEQHWSQYGPLRDTTHH